MLSFVTILLYIYIDTVYIYILLLIIIIFIYLLVLCAKVHAYLKLKYGLFSIFVCLECNLLKRGYGERVK